MHIETTSNKHSKAGQLVTRGSRGYSFAVMQYLFNDRQYMVLDGGFGTQIEDLGVTLHPQLWSAGTVIDHPEAVVKIHTDYINAGAGIITSASYQISHPLLERVLKYNQTQSNDLLLRSVQLAQSAVDASKTRNIPPAIVATSLGTYGASLADGSEYTGNYNQSVSSLRDFHGAKLLTLMSSSQTNLFAFETVPCLAEVRAIASLFSDYPQPVHGWLSMACRSERELNSGESIEDAIRYVEDATPEVECAATCVSTGDGKEAIVGDCNPSSAVGGGASRMGSNLTSNLAIGVNCTNPLYVENILHAMRDACSKSRVLVAYPNRGDAFDKEKHQYVDGTGCADSRFAELAVSWYDAGARVIGGCCKTGPDTIRAVRQALVQHVGR